MGRILALDYGTERVGVAITDSLAMTAQPLPCLPNQNRNQILYAICDLIRDHDVQEVVIGLPLHMNGDESEMSKKVRSFARRLEKKMQVSIFFEDERLTSEQANELLIEGGVKRQKRKQVIDSMAASIILQDYLSRKESKE
ncbi:MAG: Holliday junction resolvase RuvX [Lentisphaeria bacterium]|nr:Holliday junction resolvase RuvX [Lentisphaeria bacterium]